MTGNTDPWRRSTVQAPGTVQAPSTVRVRQVLGALVGRWRWLTLVAVLSCGVMVWLGFWQLDRLEQRRVINEQLASRPLAPPVVIDAAFAAAPPGEEALRALEFRVAVLRGRWEYDRERVQPNQFWEGQLGLHLFTPLMIEGSDRTVLVNRGWIPASAADQSNWGQFRDRAAEGQPVEVRGWLRVEPRVLNQIRRQEERRPLPFYVVQAPAGGAAAAVTAGRPGGAASGATGEAQDLPYRRPPVASIGEGVHSVAAAQWFVIGAIILAGLVAYVVQQERPSPPSSFRP